MYEYATRTRYSEYDENKRIRLLPFLSYLQDTSSYHSYDSGMSVDYYRRIKRAWLVNYWDICIEELPQDSAHIIAGTSPHDISGLFAYRNFWLKSAADGHYFLKADSVWFEINTDTMLPIRPADEDVLPFGESKNVLGFKAATRKVRFDTGEGFSHIARTAVSRAMLDTNHHVNNIRYIAAAHDALIDSGNVEESYFPKHIRAEYKHAAVYGDTLIISARLLTDRIYLSICSEDGREFCNLEFSTESF